MNATIGHNSQAMEPFEANSILLLDLYEEAKNWLDGEPIENEEQAEQLATLDSNIMEVAKSLDAMRVAAVTPLNVAKKEIQDKYNPLIQKDKGKADLARAAINKALEPYMLAKAEKQRLEAEQARMRAEGLERAAQEAMQRRDASNLDDIEASEKLVEEAKQANEDHKRACNAKTSVKGDGRAKHIVTKYEPIIEDMQAAGRWAWAKRPEEFRALVLKIAKEEFATGNRSIDGIGVEEIKKVRG